MPINLPRPDHDDFWLLAQAVQDLDAAAEDVGLERSVAADLDSVIYVALQRAMRMTDSIENQEQALAAAWIDGFVAGMYFQLKKSGKQNSS